MNFFKRQKLNDLEIENSILKMKICNMEDVIFKLQEELTVKGFQEFEYKKEITRLNRALRRKKMIREFL